jgi:glutamate racemase
MPHFSQDIFNASNGEGGQVRTFAIDFGEDQMSKALISSKSESAPIGIFDSGFGGLTVLRELIDWMPNENYIFFGDSARCPYGPRPLEEVRRFALQICRFLVERGCKLIVIACNTATAAGLAAAQQCFDVPIVGVVEPGARAAVHMTRNRRVGVIATQATVNSGAYTSAIHNLDAGIKVFSQAAPGFVDIAERGVDLASKGGVSSYSQEDNILARKYLDTFAEHQIDTLVMGCTHFPLVEDLIKANLDTNTAVVSSAVETAADVFQILRRRRDLKLDGQTGFRHFYTSLEDTSAFAAFGSVVLGGMDVDAQYLSLT